MSATFLHVLHAEQLKLKRSALLWLVVLGAFFTPAIVTVARLLRPAHLPAVYAQSDFWTKLWMSSWESMALFFLPMGAILIASLVAQIEYRNNTWKQVHALPIRRAWIYFAKLLIVVLALAGFVLLFDIGIGLSAAIPALVFPNVPLPSARPDIGQALRESALYLIDTLPIATAQYALALRYRNFLVPIGAGFMAWVGALGALPWKYAFAIPYTYPLLSYLHADGRRPVSMPAMGVHAPALGCAVAFVVVGLLLFQRQIDRAGAA